jgi:hypothetical protein
MSAKHSTKHSNPYREGSQYNRVFGFWRSHQVATRKELFDVAKETMTDSEANAAVTVLLSPRKASERGDCRGNCSSKGNLYFAEPLAKVKGQPRKFRLRWREVALEPRKREVTEVDHKVEAHKEATTEAPKVTVEA